MSDSTQQISMLTDTTPALTQRAHLSVRQEQVSRRPAMHPVSQFFPYLVGATNEGSTPLHSLGLSSVLLSHIDCLDDDN